MSARKLRIRFSLAAANDLDDILLYTERAFGSGQACRYQSDITKALKQIESFPEIGVPDQTQHGDVRVLPINRHRIWYVVRADCVEIAAITHVRSLRDPFDTV